MQGWRLPAPCPPPAGAVLGIDQVEIQVARTMIREVRDLPAHPQGSVSGTLGSGPPQRHRRGCRLRGPGRCWGLRLYASAPSSSTGSPRRCSTPAATRNRKEPGLLDIDDTIPTGRPPRPPAIGRGPHVTSPCPNAPRQGSLLRPPLYDPPVYDPPRISTPPYTTPPVYDPPCIRPALYTTAAFKTPGIRRPPDPIPGRMAVTVSRPGGRGTDRTRDRVEEGRDSAEQGAGAERPVGATRRTVPQKGNRR